jgi:coenzyme Q-binding protein COQ10
MPRHSETRDVPYTAQQMYALVADVMKYPEFIPWCEAMRKRSEEIDAEGAGELVAEMIVKYKYFRERFKSRVVFQPDEKIVTAEYMDGPFRHLNNRWRFEDKPEGGSIVHFDIDFEFKNLLLQATAMQVFDKAFKRMSDSFLQRAHVLYAD